MTNGGTHGKSEKKDTQEKKQPQKPAEGKKQEKQR